MKFHHHRKSIRIQGYDYGQAGLYFVTMCCHDRICCFGHVENGIMILNDWGRIAHAEWLKTSDLRSNVQLGAFVVMPNHIHGIIQITRRMESRRGEMLSPPLHSPPTDSPVSPPESNSPPSSGKGELNSPIRIPGPVRGPSQTIGAIIRGYKSAVSRQLGLNGNLWQRNYYESIIRDETSRQTITDYIIRNPVNWMDDQFYGF